MKRQSHRRIAQITSAVQLSTKGFCEISKLMMTARGLLLCAWTIWSFTRRANGEIRK